MIISIEDTMTEKKNIWEQWSTLKRYTEGTANKSSLEEIIQKGGLEAPPPSPPSLAQSLAEIDALKKQQIATIAAKKATIAANEAKKKQEIAHPYPSIHSTEYQ